MKTARFVIKSMRWFLRGCATLGMVAAEACSSEVSAPSGGDGSSASGGDSKCPDMPVAEGAWSSLQGACGLSTSDLDASDPQNPTLTSIGQGKICVTLECQQKAFDYYAVYAKCTAEDQANKAFAKNVSDIARSCNH